MGCGCGVVGWSQRGVQEHRGEAWAGVRETECDAALGSRRSPATLAREGQSLAPLVGCGTRPWPAWAAVGAMRKQLERWQLRCSRRSVPLAHATGAISHLTDRRKQCLSHADDGGPHPWRSCCWEWRWSPTRGIGKHVAEPSRSGTRGTHSSARGASGCGTSVLATFLVRHSVGGTGMDDSVTVEAARAAFASAAT